jgi:hypothetical protein
MRGKAACAPVQPLLDLPADRRRDTPAFRAGLESGPLLIRERDVHTLLRPARPEAGTVRIRRRSSTRVSAEERRLRAARVRAARARIPAGSRSKTTSLNATPAKHSFPCPSDRVYRLEVGDSLGNLRRGIVADYPELLLRRPRSRRARSSSGSSPIRGRPSSCDEPRRERSMISLFAQGRAGLTTPSSSSTRSCAGRTGCSTRPGASAPTARFRCSLTHDPEQARRHRPRRWSSSRTPMVSGTTVIADVGTIRLRG